MSSQASLKQVKHWKSSAPALLFPKLEKATKRKDLARLLCFPVPMLKNLVSGFGEVLLRDMRHIAG